MSVKWEPFRDLITLQEHMNRIFDATVERHRHEEGMAGWHPPADVCETETEVHLYIEVAGMNPDTLDLRVERDRLILQGERKRPHGPGEAYHQTEILMGAFHRTFNLSSNVDPDGIQAKYANGMLEIVLPKRAEPLPATVVIKVK